MIDTTSTNTGSWMNGQWPGMKQREDLGRGGYFGNVSCEQRKRVQLRSISGSQLSVWLEIAQMHGPAWSVLVLRRFSGKEVVDVLKEKLKAGRGTPLWTAPCCNRQAALAQEDKNVEELAQVPGPQVLGNVTQWYWQDKTSRQKLCWHEILPSTYLHAGSNPPPPLTTMLTVNACRRSGKGFLPG
jgi:hypothetical protein